MCRQIVDINISLHGAVALEVAVANLRLARTLFGKNDYLALEAPANRALEILEKHKGTDHPYTIPCLDYLGLALRAKEDIDGALAVYRRALLARETKFGDVHEEVASAHLHLADQFKDAEKHEEAEQHYRRAVEIYEEIGQPQVPELGESAAKLGSLCYQQERYDEAESWLRRAISTGYDDSDGATTRFELGKVVLFAGCANDDPRKMNEALTLLDNVLATLLREGNEYRWGETHLWRGIALTRLSEHGESRERLESAIDAFAAAREIWPSDPTVQEHFDFAKAAYDAI